jgi:prepilin-type N-terminal cleavage/methylation domain-containing protein
MKKLRAFTIIEILITMLISAVVIGIAYAGLTMLNRQFGRFQSRVKQIDQYRLLQIALKRDFDRADWIRDTIDERHLVLGCTDTLVYYYFQPNGFVQRSLFVPGDIAGINDSFVIRSQELGQTFLSDSVRLVQQISLQALVNDDSVLLTQEKTYSSQQVLLVDGKGFSLVTDR